MSDPNDTTMSAIPTVTVTGVGSGGAGGSTGTAGATFLPSSATVPAPTGPAQSQIGQTGDPHWLPERLDRERRAMLRELGIENVADAKTALADLKKRRDEEKTAGERAAEALQRAGIAEQNTNALKAAVGEFAARQMIGLTPEQKSAVTSIAGDDPALQLKAIAALMPTWATPPPAVSTPSGTTTPPATSTDTAPGPNAPPAVIESPTNHRANYEALRKTNPFAAAAYAVAHPTEIYGGAS